MESFPYQPDLTAKPHKPKCPPPPTPSKFVKGEFRESDYESDYEGRTQTVWGLNESTSYKHVQPVFTSSHAGPHTGPTPPPPSEFDKIPVSTGPPRPKFEPIEKVQPAPKPVMFKPKPIQPAPSNYIVPREVPPQTIVIQPGSPPEIAYAPGPKKTQFYRSTTSAPYHNAIQTETSNIVHFDESTEHCHRTASFQQTHKVIKFGDQYTKKEQKLEPFPYQPEPQRSRGRSVPPPPTPSKFVPGEFRESDYESEVESTRIKQKWTPSGPVENSQYRRVRPPSSTRSSSVPPPSERVMTPMEFDTQPPVMSVSRDYTDGETRREQSTSYKSFSESRSGQIMKRSHSYEPPVKTYIQPGPPATYGYVADQKLTRSSATKIASQYMDSMTDTFKSKTSRFAQDIMNDVNKKASEKPILKSGDGDAQVYREESRAAQYGKNYFKHL